MEVKQKSCLLPDLPNLAILFTASSITTYLSCNTSFSLPRPNCLFNTLEWESIFIIHFRAYKCHKVTVRTLAKFVSCGMLHHKRGSPTSLKMLNLLGDIFRGLMKQCTYPWAILYFSCKNLEYTYYILKMDLQHPN